MQSPKVPRVAIVALCSQSKSIFNYYFAIVFNDHRPPGSSGVLLVQSLCANMEIIGATNKFTFCCVAIFVFMGSTISLAPPATAHGLGAAVCKEHLATLIGSVLIVVHVIWAFI